MRRTDNELMSSDTQANNPNAFYRLYMKVLGNPKNIITPQDGGTGNTDNTLAVSDRPTGIDYSGGNPDKPENGGNETEVTTTSSFPGGLISQGWHTVGLYWGVDRLVWYLDGYPVVEDRVIVPQVPHYLLVTREMNAGVMEDNFNVPQVQDDPGIMGENVGLARNRNQLGRINADGTYDLGLTNRDHVMVDYVKVWQVQNGGQTTGNAPGVPTNVSGWRYSNTDGQIFWSAPTSTGSGIDKYRIYMDGSFIQDVTATSWYTTSLNGTSSFDIEVSAVDTQGLESDKACMTIGPHNNQEPSSAVQCGDPTNDPGNTAPGMPGSFRATVYSSSALELYWNHSTDPDGSVVRYTVTNETTNQVVRDEYAKSAWVSGLQADTDYTFSIVAVDNDGATSQSAQTTVRTRP